MNDNSNKFSILLNNINIYGGEFINKDISIKQIENCSQKNKIIIEEKDKFIFKARTVPNFACLEIMKSNNNLTIPKSPKLKTKIRSLSKLK